MTPIPVEEGAITPQKGRELDEIAINSGLLPPIDQVFAMQHQHILYVKHIMFFLTQLIPVRTENYSKPPNVAPDREIISNRAEPRHSPLELTHVPNVNLITAPARLPLCMSNSHADTPSLLLYLIRVIHPIGSHFNPPDDSSDDASDDSSPGQSHNLLGSILESFTYKHQVLIKPGL